MPAYALAADLGGTQIRVALVDRQGGILERHAIPTLAQRPRDEVVQRFVGALKNVAETVEASELSGVGVSLASPTDPETGVMYNPPNLPGWDGFSLKPVIEAEFSLRASCANDATLAALAEQKYGAGRGYKHLIYMTVSTGIGSGIVIDGKLYTGRSGFAGEIGHLTVDRNGPLCNCGNLGCLEAVASGTAVARMARERIAAGESSVLADVARNQPDDLDARKVAEAARSGDALASSIMDEVGVSLGCGVVSLLNIFDPEVIVIGGGLSRRPGPATAGHHPGRSKPTPWRSTGDGSPSRSPNSETTWACWALPAWPSTPMTSRPETGLLLEAESHRVVVQLQVIERSLRGVLQHILTHLQTLEQRALRQRTADGAQSLDRRQLHLKVIVFY